MTTKRGSSVPAARSFTLVASADTVPSDSTMTYTVQGPADARYWIDVFDALTQLMAMGFFQAGVITVTTGAILHPVGVPDQRNPLVLQADAAGALVVLITPGVQLPQGGEYLFRLTMLESPPGGADFHVLTVTAP